jgi:hypothetical protein
MRSKLLALVTLLVAASASHGAVAGAQSGNVTPAEAEQVARQYADVNAANNATLDIEKQGTIEAPPIRSIDDATFRDFKGRAQTTLGEQGRIQDRKVYVPQQSGFPQRFLVAEHVVTSQGNTAQLLLFVKESATDQWKVSMAVQLTGSFPELRADSDGFVSLIHAKEAKSLSVQPAALARKLARLWASGRSTSKDFEPGALTTGALDAFNNASAQSGLGQSRVQFKFSASEQRPVCFGADPGNAVCLFAIATKETIQPGRNRGALVQPDSREPFTGLIAPGEYKEVSYDRLAILAAQVPKRAGSARVEVVGIYEGFTAASADPSTSSQA